MPWEDVKKEMVEEKGLSEEAADQIGEYVRMQGEILPIHRKCTLSKISFFLKSYNNNCLVIQWAHSDHNRFWGCELQ